MTMTPRADVDLYRTHLRAAGRPATTVRLRLWQLRRLEEALGRPLRTATTEDLATYLADSGWAPATKHSVRATMRDFYSYLTASGRIRRDPSAALPRVRVPVHYLPPAPEDVVGDDQGRDARTQLMVDLAALEGMRRGEIARVWPRRDMMRSADGWSLIVHGKGDKDRVIPLGDELAARLLALGSGWAFPSPQGGHLSPNYVGVLVSRGLPAGWSAHSLRRRFATRAHDGTGNLVAVQEFLGHSSIATTRLYVGSGREGLRAALDAAAA